MAAAFHLATIAAGPSALEPLLAGAEQLLAGAGEVPTGAELGRAMIPAGIYLFGLCLVGLAAAWIARPGNPSARRAAVLAFACLAGTATELLVLIPPAGMHRTVPIWPVAAANLIAGAAMTAYLMRSPPSLLKQIRPRGSAQG